jgi:hypothetical protein
MQLMVSGGKDACIRKYRDGEIVEREGECRGESVFYVEERRRDVEMSRSLKNPLRTATLNLGKVASA